MSRVLVTGATGFVGSSLAHRLAEDGYDVRILVRGTSNASRPELAGAEVCIGDVTDPDSLREAVKGIDVVYHCAALYRTGGLPDSAYWAVNCEGTKNLLQASRDADVPRFIHCSTCGVHTSVKNPPADETAPYNPGDVYQAAKCEGEKEALRYHREYALPVTVLRPVGVYGPEDTRWLKLFRGIARSRFVMLGSGETLIHMVYISDLVDAFRLAADTPGSIGQVYIAGGERYVTLNELTRVIADAVGAVPPRWHIPVKPVRILSGICEDICRPLGINPPLFRRRVDFFVKNRAFDISKARRELAYTPRVSLGEGARRTSDWYRAQGML